MRRCTPRRALDQPRELGARGAAYRLERRAAGEHQADHHAGKLLVERQRAIATRAIVSTPR